MTNSFRRLLHRQFVICHLSSVICHYAELLARRVTSASTPSRARSGDRYEGKFAKPRLGPGEINLLASVGKLTRLRHGGIIEGERFRLTAVEGSYSRQPSEES